LRIAASAVRGGAEIDVALSIAWLRAEKRLGKPTFEGSELAIEAAVHPLIDGAVANDAQMARDRGLAITGSNMSGKTTYLRTIAINAVLAQAINSVFASRYRGPLLRVATSIDRLDDLGKSESYFLAEARSIKHLIDVAEDGPALLAIDELFRGTNPRDRISAASSVLRYLNSRAHVAVATHDAEVCDRLAGGYVELHFRDRWRDGRMTFDYRARPGRSPESNAIALLADVGFPSEIIEDAERQQLAAAV